VLPVGVADRAGAEKGEEVGAAALAKGFVPVAVGISGCAGGCCEKLGGGANGELDAAGEFCAGLLDFAKGFVLCLLMLVGTVEAEPNEFVDPPVALGSIDCRNGLEEIGES
jgi:hypothetical protein